MASSSVELTMEDDREHQPPSSESNDASEGKSESDSIRLWQRTPTDILQHLLASRTWTGAEDGSNVVSNGEVVDPIARIILRRIEGQKAYKNALKQQCLAHGDTWLNKVAPAGSRNERYEQWLDAGDPLMPLESLSKGIQAWRLTLSRREASTHVIDDRAGIYSIDCSIDSSTCAALIVADVDLQLICEMGDHLGIDLSFFIEHICSLPPWLIPEDLRVRPGNSGSKNGRWSHADGILYEVRGCRQYVALNPRSTKWQSMPAQTTHIRVSCLRVNESFFAVLLKNAVTAELGEFQGKALVLPLQGRSFTMFPLLEHFFHDSWNAQRLSKLLEHGCSLEQGSELLAWQLTICHYAHILDSTLLAEEYLLADLDAVEALDRIKVYRKIVARLRRHLASSATAVNRRTLQSVYDTAASREDHLDAAVAVGIQRSGSSLSPRQLASFTSEEEYNWLENKTIHVMASLNESLQLIIAAVNLRQSSIALENSRNSRRNGERATLLTLLAAIYLPLTLATSVFGMNIEEIGRDGKGPSWHAVAAMAGALLGISVVFIIIFWLWPRRRHCSDLEGRAEAENPPFTIDDLDFGPFRKTMARKRESERAPLPSRGHFKVKSKKSKRP